MENREHYFGLSIKQCEELYRKKAETFDREWRQPLFDILSKHVVRRLISLHGYTEVKAAIKQKDNCGIALPFYIPLTDQFGEEHWWGYIEVDTEFCQGTIQLSRFDQKADKTIEEYVNDLDRLQNVIMWLDRMGFWNDAQRERFILDD